MSVKSEFHQVRERLQVAMSSIELAAQVIYQLEQKMQQSDNNLSLKDVEEGHFKTQ